MEHFSAWWATKDCLASLLATSYQLDIDVASMLRDISYHEKTTVTTLDLGHYESWQELSSLYGLSLNARSLFVGTIKFFDTKYGGLVDSRKLWFFKSSEIRQALLELSDAGLIDTNLSPKDLLMIKTVPELKDFALNNSLHVHGSKIQMVEDIASGVKKEKLKRQLSKPEGVDFIRPLIGDCQKLKENLLNQYLRQK